METEVAAAGFARLTTRRDSILLSRRGAAALSDWLHIFAHPKPELRLWGIEGISQECGVSRRTVTNWAARADFPKPVPVVGGGPVWEARAVKAWVRSNRPKGGRPKKEKARRRR